MPAKNPFENLTNIFGLNKATVATVMPTFPYQTAPPKMRPPTLVNPQQVGLPGGIGQRPLGGDPMQGLVGKESDVMLQGLMQMMQQMQPPAPAPGMPPEAPEDDMSGGTGGEPEAPTPEEAPPEVTQMRGEPPQTQANLPQPGALREAVPYLPARRGGR